MWPVYLVAADNNSFMMPRGILSKIKPVAQMLGLNSIVDEYENAKKIIWEEKPDSDIQSSIIKMDKTCNQVLNELENISSNE